MDFFAEFSHADFGGQYKHGGFFCVVTNIDGSPLFRRNSGPPASLRGLYHDIVINYWHKLGLSINFRASFSFAL